MKAFSHLFAFLCLFVASAYGDLFRDLMIVDYWNCRVNERMPVTYNHLLYGGYFNMPSARMGTEGEIGAGYAYVPPYRLYNLRMQLIDRLEVSANYRVFKGVDDPVLTSYGFGDFSDKGANVKLSLVHPEDSDYTLPGVAVGLEDFIGTRAFQASYIVATQVLLDYNFEASIGYGSDRIKGFFGGATWIPFRKCGNPYFEGLSLVAEYDATPYKDKDKEPHPDGRTKKSPINYGIKYRLWDRYDFSLSSIRGTKIAFSASTYYNFGSSKGFLPKIDNPLPYRAPINTEPIGCWRPEEVMVQDLFYAMGCQGFDLMEAWISYNPCQERVLHLKVYNFRYRLEKEVRERLNQLLASLVPSNVAYTTVVMESEGFPIQEYHYNMHNVRQYAACELGSYELKVMTPLCDVSCPDRSQATCFFEKKHLLYCFSLSPKTQFFFGSAKGKFKYSLGVHLGVQGFLPTDVYYSLLFGYTFASQLDDIKDIDRLNPSQMLNVRTDAIRYYRQHGVTVDEAYLQKTWNMGRGWFSRVSAGLFEEMYGGVASEVLFYPVCSDWAIGVEGALVKKRTFSGVGFKDKIRKIQGLTPTFRRYVGSQYFANLYYNWENAKLDFRVKIGQFLARDCGARFEISRYFPSGLRITMWYTPTKSHDRVNGQRYYDKGIAFSIPTDFFYTYSCRKRITQSMSAWLRDTGAISATGLELYEMIRNQRE